jgi:Mrp family chromosome partitioning ATPase
MTENNSCSVNCASCGEKGSCEDKLTKKLSIIKHKIMVLSGKGGVGKSSVAAALALSLSKKGKKVGIIDIDFHGPSIPVIFGIKDAQLESDGEEIIPIEVGGIKIVSSGFMTNNHNDAFIWRGPMKMSMLKTLLENVKWGNLDYLIMDFPPGTGDEALSACQLVKGGSGIIVTTPQELSLADCRRCISFCDKLNLPILGIIENMSVLFAKMRRNNRNI